MTKLPSPGAAFAVTTGSPQANPSSNAPDGGVVLSGSMNWEPVRKRLLGPALEDALSAAIELREQIEIVHTVEFPLMLSALLPAFSTILAERTKPSPDTSTVEHRLRNVVLEIISRMPSNEILRPHAPHLVAVALDILTRDYEENALIASRIIFDLYKVYRSLPQDNVQPYLDFVQNAYRTLPTSVHRNFLLHALDAEPSLDSQLKITSSGNLAALETKDPSTPSDETNKDAASTMSSPGTTSPSISKIPTSPVARLSPRSDSSFRVLTECPLIVMLMFQLYPKFLRSNIPPLIKEMMEALALRAPPLKSISQGDKPLDSSGKRLYFSRRRELVAAQAKTLSFLTYLLRGFSNDLKLYEDRLAKNVVDLMSTCPREFISTRKELLVATRHLLNSDFRTGFFKHVDDLLDERLLMGSHHRFSEQTILRPLGYTTLSDFVHHVRPLLTMTQMSRVVSIFSRVLHDSSMKLPMSTQYTAVRTLLSVVEIVFHNKDRNPQVGRDILVRILKTLVDKLAALQNLYSEIEKGRRAIKPETASGGNAKFETSSGTISQLDPATGSETKDSTKDLKSMIRAIIVGHKTLIWYLNNYRAQREKEKIEYMPPRPGSNEEVASALSKITHSEHLLIDKYIVLALPCMKCLRSDDSVSGQTSKAASSDRLPIPDQYRDALTYFAAAFTTLDGQSLRRTWGTRLELIVDAIVDDSTAIIIPRHFLGANASTSFEFCSMLLDFLVEKMDELATSRLPDIHFVPPTPFCDSNEIERLMYLSRKVTGDSIKECDELKRRSSAYLQLFERVLKSLSSYPENERALRPHLKEIVSTCLRSSMEKADFKVDNYCMLLRYVFRSISAGKFEESYKELLPLIPTVLNGLFRVLRTTDDVFLRHTIIELLLTIPARLSSLLPHMNLLLRVIISALESNSGDLVNLGLRTLEFWIDNLNPEFLFPELSKQNRLFVRIMKALSMHLRPAPYPYGLLTLRLLGKLGGKNRRVLRESIDISDPKVFEDAVQQIEIECCWAATKDTVQNSEDSNNMEEDEPECKAERNNFAIQLPTKRCVEVLKRVALSQKSTDERTASCVSCDKAGDSLKWQDSKKLWDVEIDQIDLLPYCLNVIEETQQSQVEAATTILRSALTEMVHVEKVSIESIDATGEDMTDHDASDGSRKIEYPFDIQAASSRLATFNKDMEMVGFGLMFGCAIDQVREDSLLFVKGFLTNMFLVVSSHQKFFVRVDANGSSVNLPGSGKDQAEEKTTQPGAEGGSFEDGLGSQKPFGYFGQIGPLRHMTNPLTVNKSLAKFLSQPSIRTKEVGLELLKHLLSLPAKIISKDSDPSQEKERSFSDLGRGSMIFFENLLNAMCEECLSSEWNRRIGLYDGISNMIETLGKSWSQKYELEIMNVALFAVKSAPREIPVASAKSFQFFIRACSGIYGSPKSLEEGHGPFFFDMLSIPGGKDGVANKRENTADPPKEGISVQSPCEDVLQILLTEMASTKQIVRIASRYLLKHYVIDCFPREKSRELFRKHLSLIRRVLFSRSLRLLPLPEQVGAVEALTVVVDQIPEIFPLDDQHLLAFLSELLKMSSVADGDMTDSNLGGSVIDKNGYAVSADKASPSKESKVSETSKPSSALFLRRDCIITIPEGKVVIPEELPCGIQLRVSSISLLRSVIRGHPDPFFDAETLTPIGNIRPHVISLLFRSLVSIPLKAVMAAHDALRDVLTLSVVTTEGSEGQSKSKSRLRKELLQTCIRPVLLNLRDYSRLSVPLLRGLSRLLSLLSSWFNKTLGEKLLDHLQKWTDPNKMIVQKIWKEGEEPDVAAAIINLFALLPHASHFVEPLVKTTIKLEACLPGFKSRNVISPYRKPLARYLNKYCQNTTTFFFQRLKTPLYSELFQDLIKLPESSSLREYLGGTQCSASLLKVCFERPLAIIQSEKTSSGVPGMGSSPPQSTNNMNATERLALHGIQAYNTHNQKESLLRQDVEMKNKKLQILQRELIRIKELHSKASAALAVRSTPEVQASLEEMKRKYRIGKASYERSFKELNESKQRYDLYVSQTGSVTDKLSTTRPMNIESLELQHQGFRLVETLIKNDENYLKDHNDVLRAFRWFWRSKGRLLRLHHEESLPPRYHEESKLLASFLVDYSRNIPSDVDLLFELIRIFQQPSTNDFSFVRSFLSDTVSNKLDGKQKQQIIQRFFAILGGESPEEIKTLSMQLVVYPMLRSSFLGANMKDKSTKATACNSDSGSIEEKETTLAQLEFDFIDASVVKKFVKEVLFRDGKQIICGDRLRVELLRLSSLFLEFAPNYVEEFGNDLIKFCWVLLKSDDTSCKSWAYMVVCRVISVLKASPKFILQVYTALLRSHQQEGKDMVRAALGLLVPAALKKLEEHERIKVIEQTNRIMVEEGNSVPQLSHIWQTIVNNPEIFYSHRHQFVRYMINSLNRLGLPTNAPPENRALAVSIVELLLQWESRHGKRRESSSSTSEDVLVGKRLGEALQEATTGLSHVDKKRKTLSGSVEVSSETDDGSTLLLDQSMVDSMANFLVRLKILLADPKIDTSSLMIGPMLTPMFRSVASKWKGCNILPVYFEKVVSMCRDENAAESDGSKTGIKGQSKPSTKNTKTSKSASKSTASGLRAEDGKRVTSQILLACLEIVLVLAEEDPDNVFLVDNSSQLNEILTSCFRFARRRNGDEVRHKLRKFVVSFLSSESNSTDAKVSQSIKVLLEKCLVDAEIEHRKAATSNVELIRQGARSRQAASEEEKAEESSAVFALEVIKEVGHVRSSFFKVFSSSLLTLLGTLVKKHTAAASSKQKQGGVSYVPQAGACSIRQMYHTPVAGILSEYSSQEYFQSTATGATGRSAKARDPYPSKELKRFDQNLRSTVIILEILGDSDMPYSFTPSRKALFQTISSILDSSNNVQLLISAVRVVGKWLLSDTFGGPLTVKERNSFLWKIASFDFNGLPDVVSQPLADLVSHYVIALLTGRDIVEKARREKNDDRSGFLRQRATDSDGMIMGRSLVACLLSANHSLREMLLSLYITQTVAEGKGQLPVINDGIPIRRPVEILWQLFHSDFEGLGGRYWVVVFVELLLANVHPVGGVDDNKLDCGLKRLLPLPRKMSAGNTSSVNDDYLIKEYEFFCETLLGQKSDFANGGERFTTALRHLAHGDVVVCQNLFQTLLPASWDSVKGDGTRLRLIPAMESLVSRPFHSQFLKYTGRREDQRSTNVIRSFLNGVIALRPLPTLDVDLLVSLAETYNCWYEVLSILEDQYLVLSSKELSATGRCLKDKILLAMRHCYRCLGESNTWMTLALESCSLPETKRAASLDVYGMVDEALEAYTGLVELVESGTSSPPDLEMSVWEERWVELHREQCQLAVVSEYAKTSENTRLVLECAWKQQDWDRVRSLCSSASLVADVESGEPALKMSETLLAVADGKLSDVENLHAQTAQLCLYKWQLLPELTSGSMAHASLLHFFHRLVEIRESGQIMVETSNHSNGKTLPDLKNLLNAWRHRLPNDYEELTTWDEIFTWRAHMFSAITSNFSWSEPSTLATLHDRPWTAIRMSMTARKQGMRQTALLLLNKLTDSRAMGVSDAYLKLREQILAYNNPESELERTGGLNLINTTNLSYFDASEKSELFRLKAMFLASLRRTSKSNQAYCHSVQICPTHSKAWVSWGGLCSSLGALTEKQADQLASNSGGSSEGTREARVASAKKVAQYLAQAMGCYLEAVQIDAHEKSRIYLPKCLWILTKDGSSAGVLCQTLENRGTKLPPWVWLPWIPQLLTGLCRIEGRAIKAILTRLVKAYPQAVYYSLRAFYLERRDVERAKGVPIPAGQHMPSVAYAEEMMSTLRRSHASLWSSLEAILEELIVKFRPSYEEELLATISALLERAESHAEKQSVNEKRRLEDEDAMVASFSKTLGRIAAKFFRASDSSSGSNRRDERLKKIADFKRKYKADFENDFQVSASEGQTPTSTIEAKPQFQLAEYIARLQKWKQKLEAQVSCTPSALSMIKSSHSLAMFAGDIPDLWPGACDTRYLRLGERQAEKEDTGRTQSSPSSSAAIARKAALTAAVAAASAAAREGVGGEYGGGSAAIEIPGQYCPNSCSSADTKPCPELHAKLVRFEPFVEVLRRNDQLVRRAGMVGSDGRTHKFLLQFAIPYWTRTDERVAQTHYIVDKFLRGNYISARNHISIQPNAAIPVAQRLRMSLDTDSRIALDEVFRKNNETNSKGIESISAHFLKELTQRLQGKVSPEATKEEKANIEKAVRLDIYNEICSSKVDNRILLRHIQRLFDSPESYFHFRRAFASHLAANSLFQYAFSVTERTPQRFVIIQSNARILSPDFRVSYTNQGFIEGQQMPFRMTPNIESLVGKPYLDGRFLRSFAMISGAIKEHKDEFDPILRLLMRDDILAWYSKSQAKTDNKTQELERQLIERVSKNVSTLQLRFAECSPNKRSKEPADARVQNLCAAATNTEKLCMMPTSYHPWL